MSSFTRRIQRVPAVSPPALGGWPDATNTGPEAAGYTNLTAWTDGYLIGPTYSNTVISGKIFDGIGPQVTGNNVTFRGCIIRETYPNGFLLRLDGTNTTFEDCRFTPAVGVMPPVSLAASYQQGIKMINGVGLTVRRCEFWGFGNAIEFEPSSATQANPILVEDCWMHDAADQSGDTYHHDGILSSYASSWVSVDHCRIVSGGNTNAIAFQSTGGQWSKIVVNNCLLGGFGYTVNIGDSFGGNNITLTNNVFDTSIVCDWGPFKNDWSGFTGTNVWQGNTWDTGGYWWPTDGASTGGHGSDWAG
ncbi:right-handed parallel beta-helix repeat-containing protein [Candidatus Saccharibacteria bacterium]|nr:MAG: right-handed parallel beta-helix repeat-containing protein [Candidatus Saccharibacteria bacterium]